MKIFSYVLCVLFLCNSWNKSVHAETATAVYRAEGLNITLLSSQISLDLSDTDYKIETTAVAQGILALFIHAQTVFETTGKIKGDSLKITDSVMKLKDNHSIEVKRPSFADKPEYIDYQSLLVHLMRLKTKQTHSVLVSDGKRDMEIQLIYGGEKELSSVYKKLNGKAENWSVRIKVLNGKKKGWFFKRINEEIQSPLQLYFLSENQHRSLILGTFDTGVVGKLFIVREQISHE